MDRTWPPIVYEIAFAIGAIAGLLVLPLIGIPLLLYRGFLILAIIGGILGIVLVGIIDFFVHGMWRRPPSDPDPWDGLG